MMKVTLPYMTLLLNAKIKVSICYLLAQPSIWLLPTTWILTPSSLQHWRKTI